MRRTRQQYHLLWTGISDLLRRYMAAFDFRFSNRAAFEVSDMVRADLALLSYQRPFQLTCAHDRSVIEVTVLGSLAKRFHAVQQAPRIAS